ncbi:NADH-ubiquinone oxidoreductase chain E [hydrothermal vent metagenome]|uniref:NADH-ubiquinone oxidoreductase chain E n=1 Tax=hydrothermal vent metagenome TaxID=652676 RepID=A0A3B1BQ31_9ZZZZ
MAQQKKTQTKLGLISEASKAEINRWIAKYPPERKRSAVMAALRIVQDQNKGYLSNDLKDAVAEYLDLPPIAVYEVATFYSMYELEAVGKHKICVCTNISCMLRGSDEIVDHLTKRLGIGLGETTNDGRFTLKEVECLGACVEAPMFQIGDQYHGNLTPKTVDEILDGLD